MKKSSDMTSKQESDANNDPVVLPHHQQFDLCRTRPAYRQGRKLTAVKTYSISSESSHLLLFGVPKINIRRELKNKLSKFGKILFLAVKNEYPAEEFTECFHAKYDRIQSARVAKKVMDAKTFFGGCLHICYAPELETIEETRQKLLQRRIYVYKQLSIIAKEARQQSISSEPIYQNMPNNMPQHYANGFTNNYKNGVSNSNNVPHSVNLDFQPNFKFSPVNGTKIYSNRNHFVDNNVNNTQGSNTNLEHGETSQNLDNVSHKSTTDVPAYVFKRKKKRREKDQDIQMKIAKLMNEKEKQKEEKIDTQPSTASSVVVYDTIDTPNIINTPKQTPNKIILNINMKLI